MKGLLSSSTATKNSSCNENNRTLSMSWNDNAILLTFTFMVRCGFDHSCYIDVKTLCLLLYSFVFEFIPCIVAAIV